MEELMIVFIQNSTISGWAVGFVLIKNSTISGWQLALSL
jgi:hypothetical protein